MRMLAQRGLAVALLVAASALSPSRPAPPNDAVLAEPRAAQRAPLVVPLPVSPISLEIFAMKSEPTEATRAMAEAVDASLDRQRAEAPDSAVAPDPGVVPGGVDIDSRRHVVNDAGGNHALTFERAQGVVMVYGPPPDELVLAVFGAEEWAEVVATMTLNGNTAQSFRSALRHFETSS